MIITALSLMLLPLSLVDTGQGSTNPVVAQQSKATVASALSKIRRILQRYGQSVPVRFESIVREGFAFRSDERIHKALVTLAAEENAGETVYEVIRLQPGGGAWAVGLLWDPRANVRRIAVRILVSESDAPSTPQLVSMTGDQDAVVREWLTRALWVRGDSKCVATLRKMVRDLHPLVRAGAISGLGQCGWQGIQEYATVLKDESPEARVAAARSLCAAYGRDTDKRLIIPLLKDRIGRVRATAMEVLNWIDPKEGHRAAAVLLDDREIEVRHAARRILGLKI